MYGHTEAVVKPEVKDNRGMILPGKTFWVEGEIKKTFGMDLINALMSGNWAARHYKDRAVLFGLPTDEEAELYYGKIDGLGHILHRSEFEYAQ